VAALRGGSTVVRRTANPLVGGGGCRSTRGTVVLAETPEIFGAGIYDPSRC
jgi:hypothetical protein